ncbi:MAG TPA: hypothetical protein VMF52_20530 [Steroidobacteraceae bacterium]|nr:hypothetical protein [Steroidobacteraceae bacterium]
MAARSAKKKTRPASRPALSPNAQLQSFIRRFGAKDQKLIRTVRTALRKRFPAANELVYDYNAFFVVGYSPTDRGIDGVVSIAARPDDVRLYLMHGNRLADTKKLLKGSGKQTRFIQVESASQLAHPDVKALIAASVKLATVPLPARGKGKLFIRSVAPGRGPRRKAR